MHNNQIDIPAHNEEENLPALLDKFVSGSKAKLAGALAFGLLILLWIFSFSDYNRVYETIRTASLYYVVLGFAAIISSFLIRTWRWGLLLRTSGYTVPADILFKSLMFGFLLNYLLPARAGDIARGAALKTAYNIPMGISLSTVVIERAMDMFTLALTLGVATMLVSRNESMFIMAIVPLAIAFLLVAALVIAYIFNEFISRMLGKIFPAISGFMTVLKEGLYRTYNNPASLVLAIAVSIPVWLLEISGIYIAAMAIGYPIPFPLAAVAGITSFIGQTVPITPGGLGIHEGTMAAVFALFGMPFSTGVALALVDHFVRISVVLAFGISSTIHLGFISGKYSAQKRDKS